MFKKFAIPRVDEKVTSEPPEEGAQERVNVPPINLLEALEIHNIGESSAVSL